MRCWSVWRAEELWLGVGDHQQSGGGGDQLLLPGIAGQATGGSAQARLPFYPAEIIGCGCAGLGPQLGLGLTGTLIGQSSHSRVHLARTNLFIVMYSTVHRENYLLTRQSSKQVISVESRRGGANYIRLVSRAIPRPASTVNQSDRCG